MRWGLGGQNTCTATRVSGPVEGTPALPRPTPSGSCYPASVGWLTSPIFNELLCLTSESLVEASPNLKDQEPEVPSTAGPRCLFGHNEHICMLL